MCVCVCASKCNVGGAGLSCIPVPTKLFQEVKGGLIYHPYLHVQSVSQEFCKGCARVQHMSAQSTSPTSFRDKIIDCDIVLVLGVDICTGVLPTIFVFRTACGRVACMKLGHVSDQVLPYDHGKLTLH